MSTSPERDDSPDLLFVTTTPGELGDEITVGIERRAPQPLWSLPVQGVRMTVVLEVAVDADPDMLAQQLERVEGGTVVSFAAGDALQESRELSDQLRQLRLVASTGEDWPLRMMQLQDEGNALRQDALRWRELRDGTSPFVLMHVHDAGFGPLPTHEVLDYDAAIDAVIGDSGEAG